MLFTYAVHLLSGDIHKLIIGTFRSGCVWQKNILSANINTDSATAFVSSYNGIKEARSLSDTDNQLHGVNGSLLEGMDALLDGTWMMETERICLLSHLVPVQVTAGKQDTGQPDGRKINQPRCN